jgi:hypothetical protein
VSGPARIGPLFRSFVCVLRLPSPFPPWRPLGNCSKSQPHSLFDCASRFFFFVSRFISLQLQLTRSLAFLESTESTVFTSTPLETSLARSLDFHRLTRSAPRQNAFVYGARRRLLVRCCSLWHNHQRCRKQRRPVRPRCRELAHCPRCVRHRPCHRHSGCPNNICLADRHSVSVVNRPSSINH